MAERDHRHPQALSDLLGDQPPAGSLLQGQNEANITPLADVTTTLIVVFLILYFGYPLLEAYRHLYPQQYPVGNLSPADLGMEYEDVTLHTEDGLNLYGYIFTSARSGPRYERSFSPRMPRDRQMMVHRWTV